MEIIKFTISVYRSNCYIIKDKKDAFIIDPGFDHDDIVDYIKKEKLNIQFIYATHGHVDHIAGINRFKSLYGCPVYAPKKDEIWFSSDLYNQLGTVVHVDHFVKEGDQIDFKGTSYTVIETPGHSEGGTVLYDQKESICFSGDTLFYKTVGRTDLPFASFDVLKKSIYKLYEMLPDDTILYPGHGRSTTIKFEKVNNMFVKQK